MSPSWLRTLQWWSRGLRAQPARLESYDRGPPAAVRGGGGPVRATAGLTEAGVRLFLPLSPPSLINFTGRACGAEAAGRGGAQHAPVRAAAAAAAARRLHAGVRPAGFGSVDGEPGPGQSVPAGERRRKKNAARMAVMMT